MTDREDGLSVAFDWTAAVRPRRATVASENTAGHVGPNHAMNSFEWERMVRRKLQVVGMDGGGESSFCLEATERRKISLKILDQKQKNQCG